MIKRDKWDAIFSELVRERADWTCEDSGRRYPEGQRRGLHCSHFWSRRHLATRWHPWNAFSLGYGAHQKFGGDPGAHWYFVRERLGQAKLDAITKLAHTPIKWSLQEKDSLYEHMKRCLDDMREKRRDGVTGRIEFPLWPGFDELTPAIVVRSAPSPFS